MYCFSLRKKSTFTPTKPRLFNQANSSMRFSCVFIRSMGVAVIHLNMPLIWYNSGMFKWITATPIDRMKTHENRMEEFAWLKSLGFVGVKVDFFLSEKQYMIDYYLDILEDAAQFEMMVNFHGSLVPRGWARTYPHLMTMEAVRGAEWYNNGPEFTYAAPEHNTVNSGPLLYHSAPRTASMVMR